MSKITDDIKELLQDDMVSHGWVLQSINDREPLSKLKEVLTELLSEDVEIGEAKSASPSYVEFIAWKGTVDERVMRAIEAVNRQKGQQGQEFAYWLALRKNVDRFEVD